MKANNELEKLTRRGEQDALDKTVLNILTKGKFCWTDLEKKVLATCFPWATGGRFHARLNYLRSRDYVRRVARGVYEITDKGRKYLEIL